MRLAVDFDCDGEAFSGVPPRDLLGESARVLRALAAKIERREFSVPNEGRRFPEDIKDADGEIIGVAVFEVG